MRTLIFLSLGIALTLGIDDRVLHSTNNDFTGFKVLRTNPTESQTDFLRLLETNKVGKAKRPSSLILDSSMTSGLRSELTDQWISW